MINRLSRFGASALNGLLALLLLFAIVMALPSVRAQTQYLPIPSGVCTTAGQILVAVDANNVQCTSSPAIGASGTAITQIRVYSQSVTPSQVAAQVCAEQSVSLTGVTTADKVFMTPPAIASSPGASPVAVRVSAADELAVTYCNPASSAATPASGTFAFTAIRS